MIYGDNPQKINEREDKLGLRTYSYTPLIASVMQSGNLYVYCINSPVIYLDDSGNSLTLVMVVSWTLISITAGIIGGVSNLGNTGGFWAGFLGGLVNGAISGGVGILAPAFTAFGTTAGAFLGSLITGALNGIKGAELWSDAGFSALVGLLFVGPLATYINYAFGLNEVALAAIQDLIKLSEWTQALLAVFLGEALDAVSYDISSAVG